MELISLVVGMVLGVAVYRHGRREGEAGRVMSPMMHRRGKRKKEAALLAQIEGYNGQRPEG